MELIRKFGRWSVTLLGLAAASVSQSKAAAAPGSPGIPLEILGAGIASAEDEPFVPSSYRFLSGEFLYFVFQVSGYQTVKKGEDSGQVRIAYEVDLLDNAGVPLVPAEKGTIDEETSAKDKDWLPKRRVSFQLPSFLAAGTFTLRATLTDEVSKATATRDFPFKTGGHVLTPGDKLAVQRFTFYRTEETAIPLVVAYFRAGDTVWARFDITGFKTGPGNKYQLEYDVTALKPDGSVLFKQANAAQLGAGSFYPAQYVPGILSLTTTGDLIHTEYTIQVTVRDLIGKQTVESRHNFRIE